MNHHVIMEINWTFCNYRWLHNDDGTKRKTICQIPALQRYFKLEIPSPFYCWD